MARPGQFYIPEYHVYGLYREGGTFFTLQVYERVGISRAKVYERVGKPVI